MCLAQGPQHSDTGEARTRDPSVSSQALYHWAIAFLSWAVGWGYELIEANEVTDMANLNPRGMFGRIYVVDHWALIHTKYISCGPHGFREDF